MQLKQFVRVFITLLVSRRHEAIEGLGLGFGFGQRPFSVKPWTYWQKQSFNNLIEMASRDAALGKLVPFIDRHVRNALAHGPPVIERSTSRCQFRDRDVQVTWSWEEYFRNTRALTYAVLACSACESFCQLIEIQVWVRALAPLIAAGEGPSS